MKTFKLVLMQVVKEDGLMDIALDDGLIINKEDEHNSWLMEAYIPTSSHYSFFQEAYINKTDLLIQVVITKKDNKPALFQAKATSVTKLKNHISVLLEGIMKNKKNNYPELLLNDLLQKGYSGVELLTEFKSKINNKPKTSFPKH